VPAFISILVLWLNSRHYHQVALISYFVLYPVATSIVYLSGINLGVELSFVLYGILSVFFLEDISQMLFAVGLSMVSYFVLAVLCKIYTYQLATATRFLYPEPAAVDRLYLLRSLPHQERKYRVISSASSSKKRRSPAMRNLLKRQTEELTELNALKNKLFSVIAHDLKSPMYALRNLFQNMQQYDLPADEIKTMLPEVVNELTYTTSLMENLLQWARSQMQADSVKPAAHRCFRADGRGRQIVALTGGGKKIKVELKAEKAACAYADKYMINWSCANLLSNASSSRRRKG